MDEVVRQLPKAVVKNVQDLVSTQRKIDFLDALQVYSNVLGAVPLPASGGEVDVEQAIKDTARETVLLNGVQFAGEGKLAHFLSAVRAVSLSAGMGMAQSEVVSRRLLCSTSRTSSGADTYFLMKELFEQAHLLLKPRVDIIPPVRIEMRAGSGVEASDTSTKSRTGSNGQRQHRDYSPTGKMKKRLHSGGFGSKGDHDGGIAGAKEDRKNVLTCTVQTTNLFGLYQMEDIEACTRSKYTKYPDPWVLLDGVVTETIHFEVVLDEDEFSRSGEEEQEEQEEQRVQQKQEKDRINQNSEKSMDDEVKGSRTLSICSPELPPELPPEILELF